MRPAPSFRAIEIGPALLLGLAAGGALLRAWPSALAAAVAAGCLAASAAWRGLAAVDETIEFALPGFVPVPLEEWREEPLLLTERVGDVPSADQELLLDQVVMASDSGSVVRLFERGGAMPATVAQGDGVDGSDALRAALDSLRRSLR